MGSSRLLEAMRSLLDFAKSFGAGVSHVLTVELIISTAKRTWKGPAWAVLVAYGMCLGAGVAIAAILALTRVVDPKTMLEQILKAAEYLPLSP